MLYLSLGSETAELSLHDVKEAVYDVLYKLGSRNKVLAIPPDFTRFHSKAGEITTFAYQYYGSQLKEILPALGTHRPMSNSELDEMFTGIPHNLFRVHDWRNDVVTIGTVPGSYLSEISGGLVDYSWPAMLNKHIMQGKFDLILSIGQVVPHEVIGMANYNKNIFIGTGGAEAINKSHFLGAVYGMERIMGQAQNPVRRLLNYASDNFCKELPIVYFQTVIGRDEATGKLVIRGVFAGNDEEVFYKAAELSLKVNFNLLEKPLKKVVVYLTESEYRSTWLGNKSIYRTRMALANGGELIVLAPALHEFGEDPEIDRLIRKYGYRGTLASLEATRKNDELKNNLSAAAHLIHGSSEGRFSITYCPGHLSKKEIESVDFNYAPLDKMLKKYNPMFLKDGYNLVDGEEIYFISNPALGLWASRDRF